MLIIVSWSSITWGFNYFSPLWREEIFRLETKKDTIQLQEMPVIIGSVRITGENGSLSDNLDYRVDHQSGIINFFDNYGQVKIEYAVYPRELRKKYFYFEELIVSAIDTTDVYRREKSAEYKPLELLVKGNKTVTISLAENEDFRLDQSLFLKISGKLSDDMSIEAQISDSESPLTPEGDTREISNLDQIFIRIFSKNYELGFGDLHHQFLNSGYLSFQPYFEGIKFRWGNNSRITAAAALSKAKSSTAELNGIDGKQGPYWLSDAYGGETLIVPGSERIYLNGIELQRGDDYIIDYSEGSITFTENHFIASNDKIYAVYQYSDESYRKQILLQDSEWQIYDNWSIGSSIYYRKDDADNPLTRDFSASDLANLAAAGDQTAFGNGIYETEEGLGEYILTSNGFFEYVGYNSTGTYNLNFYATASGDYIYNEAGAYYEYMGPGEGDYALGVRLESPEAQGNYTLWSRWQLGDIAIKGEVLFSSNDRNTLSDIDDEDNLSWAATASAQYEKTNSSIRPLLGIKLRGRTAGLYTFNPISSAADIYETFTLPDTLDQRELIFEAGLDYKQVFFPRIVLRRQEAGNDYIHNYFAASSEIKQYGIIPKINYRLVNWENEFALNKSNYILSDASAAYTLEKWELGYGYELLENNFTDYMLHRTKNLAYLQRTDEAGNIRIYQEQVIADSIITPQRKISTTCGIQSKYTLGKQQIELDLAHRVVKDSLDTKYDLAKINYSGALGKMINLSARYRIRNLDFYPKIRQLVFVGIGKGYYNEDGEIDDEGDYSWQIVSIDYSNPLKSLELTTSGMIALRPQKPLPDFWQRMRIELDGAINEQSTTTNIRKLYLLNNDVLQQKDTTVYGTQRVKSLMWYDLMRNKLTLRLIKEYEDRLDNRYQDAKKVSITREEAYLRWKFDRQIGFEFFLKHRIEADTRYDSQSESTDFAWETRYSSSSLFNYLIALEYGRENGNSQSNELSYNLNKIEIQQTVNWYHSRNNGIFCRLKFRHNNRKGNDNELWLKEKRAGNIFIWDVSYNYKLNEYMKLLLEYKGDQFPAEGTSHEFKMEVSAEF
jgi:hypothetical protein